MANSKQTGTNAADSAPGVDDGRARGAEPDHGSKPGGRRGVWIGIVICLLVLAAIFISRPMTHSRGGDQMVEQGTTQAQLDQSGATASR